MFRRKWRLRAGGWGIKCAMTFPRSIRMSQIHANTAPSAFQKTKWKGCRWVELCKVKCREVGGYRNQLISPRRRNKAIKKLGVHRQYKGSKKHLTLSKWPILKSYAPTWVNRLWCQRAMRVRPDLLHKQNRRRPAVEWNQPSQDEKLSKVTLSVRNTYWASKIWPWNNRYPKQE